MNIGILDVDGHHFPNFALMRASAYHKARGDQVEWATPFNGYDKVLASKVLLSLQTLIILHCRQMRLKKVVPATISRRSYHLK